MPLVITALYQRAGTMSGNVLIMTPPHYHNLLFYLFLVLHMPSYTTPLATSELLQPTAKKHNLTNCFLCTAPTLTGQAIPAASLKFHIYLHHTLTRLLSRREYPPNTGPQSVLSVSTTPEAYHRSPGHNPGYHPFSPCFSLY